MRFFERSGGGLEFCGKNSKVEVKIGEEDEGFLLTR